MTLSPAVKKELSKTEAGKWFVAHWPLLSFCVSGGMISVYLTKGILKYGSNVKSQLKNNPKLSKNIDELIEESKKVEGLGGNTRSRSIIATKDPIKVKAFEEGLEKLENLRLSGKITGKNAVDYLEDAMPYFNHKAVDGKVIQVDYRNCGNTVEVLHHFLKTGEIKLAKKSGYQKFEEVTTKFKAGRFIDVGNKLKALIRLNDNPALIKDGDSFIFYGAFFKEKVTGRNGVFSFNMEGHYMYGIKRNKTIHLYDPQTGEFAKFDTTQGSEFMKLLINQWEKPIYPEGYQYLTIK